MNRRREASRRVPPSAKTARPAYCEDKMSDTVEMFWEDYRGNKRTRAVNQIADVRTFLGTPGYSMLVVAANTHLSVSDIERFLEIQARETPA